MCSTANAPVCAPIAQKQNYRPLGGLVQRLMVWCRAGLRSDFLSACLPERQHRQVYTDCNYERQTIANR